MMGFEILPPVVSWLTPGWWAMASMIFVEAVARNTWGEMMDRYGRRSVLQFCIACHARYRQFVQLQMAEKHVRRVLRMMMS